MSAIFLTALLFHTITLKQLNYYTENQNHQWSKYYQSNNVELLCEIENLECENIKDFNKKYILNIYQQLKPYMDNNDNYFYYMIANDNNINNRILSRKPIAFIKYKNENYIIIDNNNYINYLKFNEKIFGILGITSHIIWIFGIIYLINYHQKRLSNNRGFKN